MAQLKQFLRVLAVGALLVVGGAGVWGCGNDGEIVYREPGDPTTPFPTSTLPPTFTPVPVAAAPRCADGWLCQPAISC